MTLQALGGLAVLNLLFLAAGSSVLWLVRGVGSWTELLRLGGLAYLVGVAGIGGSWALLLIAGVRFSLALVVGLPLAVALAAGVLARRRAPRRAAVAEPGSQWSLVVSTVGIAAAGVLLLGFFRAARLSGLYWWDAWSFWIPKATSIYLLGEIDPGFFEELPGAAYPPLVPVLDAAAFHLMGSADVVTLHVQFWFLAVGFVWALAGLLVERAPAWIVWPFVLALLVAPRIGERFRVTEADLFLDYLFVIASVLVLYWIVERERWQLVAATVLMSGMVLTKREGLLLAALLVATAALVCGRQWRATWPALLGSALVVAAVAAPWRIWYTIHGVGEETPTDGLAPTDNVDRLWPSLELAFDVLLSSEYWSVLVPVTIGALILAAAARAYRPVVFFGTLVLLVTLAGGWITWAIPELEITQDFGANPIVRYMGAAALLCAAASPLLLAAAWRSVTGRGDAE